MSFRIHSLPAGRVVVDDRDLRRVRADLARNRDARVKVGVLGSKASRKFDIERAVVSRHDGKDQRVAVKRPAAMNNAELGAIHEFGSVIHNLPSRSFLRMPLIWKLPIALKNQSPERWTRLLVKRGILAWLDVLGAVALSIIQAAFASGGFGRWQPLKAFTIRRKGSAAILIDTAQLRQSVTAEVVRKGES